MNSCCRQYRPAGTQSPLALRAALIASTLALAGGAGCDACVDPEICDEVQRLYLIADDFFDERGSYLHTVRSSGKDVDYHIVYFIERGPSHVYLMGKRVDFEAILTFCVLVSDARASGRREHHLLRMDGGFWASPGVRTPGAPQELVIDELRRAGCKGWFINIRNCRTLPALRQPLFYDPAFIEQREAWHRGLSRGGSCDGPCLCIESRL